MTNSRTTDELIEEYDFVRSGWFLRSHGLKESDDVRRVAADFAAQFSELVNGLRAERDLRVSAETAMQEALDQLENERWDSPDFDPAKILRNALNPEGASA